MLVVFLIGQESCLTYKSGKGDFKSFPSTLVRLLALSFLSWVQTQFSRAIPREPGAQEDQTNRRTEKQKPEQWRKVTSLESYTILVGAWLPSRVISGASRWEEGTAQALPSAAEGRKRNKRQGDDKRIGHLYKLRQTTYTMYSGTICTLKKP